MSELNYILDQPLPISQDFKSLKNEGLACIQLLSGNEWTNLNPSDSGITILDQLCYALTELGYCNDFSINDILTNSKGKLELHDQFYLPEEILTTSPITIDDYRKYIIDGCNEVENVVIISQQSNTSFIKGIYIVYLSLLPSIISNDEIIKICSSVFYRLNKRRNIGEVFMMPMPLEPAIHLLIGELQVAEIRNATTILSEIQNNIRNYIFPKVVQMDYKQLVAKGETTDEIFNGPVLQHGWVQDNTLEIKKNNIRIRDVIDCIQSVTGVVTISNLCFNLKDNPIDSITCLVNQLLILDLSGLKVTSNTNTKPNLIVSIPSITEKNNALTSNISFGTSENLNPELPKGKFRDINTYYSIQNTFPEIFAVGANAINSNASNHQIAQSRQLKGYLTLFDQVLANQFSQLANIPKLFSFKNSLCGTPSDQKEYYAVKSGFEKEHPEYPVPYLTFSPTYFYQSLYHTPDIKQLLKDNDTFNFSLEIESKKRAEKISWDQYKQDPYNPYMHGLMELIEDETNNLTRRDALLDHLLARHGEAPILINALINGSTYTRNSLKDKVIFKSLFLQNLGILSYYRQKAYNYLGAKQLNPLIVLTEVDCDFENSNWIKNIKKDYFINYTSDFIFKSNKVDAIEKLKKIDFINYSALELKLNMLLGLRVQYVNYITKLVNQLEKEKNNFNIVNESKQSQKNKKIIDNINSCCWMIKERKGFILIENCLLMPEYQFMLNGKENSYDAAHLNMAIMKIPTIELIFPDFIPQFKTKNFKERINLFLANTLPIEVTYRISFVDADALKTIIPAFVDWHNSLVFNSSKANLEQLLIVPENLISAINNIKTAKDNE